MSPENQILDAIAKVISSGVLDGGWVVVLALAYLFRKKIGAALINGTGGNLQTQITNLKENHLHEVTDRLDRMDARFDNIEAELSDIRERCASVETELIINRERRG